MVYGENVQSICCVCGAADETVAHVVSECSKLTQKEYKHVLIEDVSKCFIGNYLKIGDSIKQKNGIYTSQKKF